MFDYNVVDGHLTDVKYNDDGNFYCYKVELTTLEGCPKIINGVFNCAKNDLTSLKECPEVVNGDFICYSNKLTSLKGCPKVVKDEFICSCNPELEDISDLSEGVKKLFIYECPNIKVFPKHIKDTLEIVGMSKEVLERLKQQKHLEIVEEDYNTITIREKLFNEQFLETV